MRPYRVSFVMQVGCEGMEQEIESGIRTLLKTQGMALATLRSVQAEEISEGPPVPERESAVALRPHEAEAFERFLDGLQKLSLETSVVVSRCPDCAMPRLLYLETPAKRDAAAGRMVYTLEDVDHLRAVLRSA